MRGFVEIRRWWGDRTWCGWWKVDADRVLHFASAYDSAQRPIGRRKPEKVAEELLLEAVKAWRPGRPASNRRKTASPAARARGAPMKPPPLHDVPADQLVARLASLEAASLDGPDDRGHVWLHFRDHQARYGVDLGPEGSPLVRAAHARLG